MNLIGNLLFLLLGGFALSLGWALAGLLCCLTIIGIPIGLQCFKFAGLVLWPFGREIHYRQAGAVSLLANILWLVFFGLELALASAVMGLVFCVTLIGIPFGLQYFKFARLALMPFGAVIVTR
ncbi:MAG: YccF domain-containing protein [Clostridiaceae bacterium]|jgi:uncharacterized membrane protein YccF (DUF307 family)|nr:YccF domain-containing protein [Clostridiaceae bacterium]